MLKYINTLQLKDKNILEPGAGSGLTAIFCAKQNAYVTATDINKTAIENIKINATVNNISMNIIYSDLFENIPFQVFDYIIINPPYYKRKPLTEEQFAWYCGENGEYFDNLFQNVHSYISDKSTILMVLSEDCDIEMIRKKAAENKLTFAEIVKKRIWFETNYIFSIQITAFHP